MIRSFLHHRVTLKKLTRDPRGSVEVTTSFTDVPAFVQGAQKATLDNEGRTIVASAIAYVDLDAPVDFTHDDWRLEWEDRDWEVLSSTKRTDGLTGARHHYALMIR